MQVEIDDDVFSEFEYLSKLLSKDDNPMAGEPDEIINYVLVSIADGSRRPGSWERQMLQSMGIVAVDENHHVYREAYGEPK